MIFQFSDGEFSDPIATSLKMWKKKIFLHAFFFSPPTRKLAARSLIARGQRMKISVWEREIRFGARGAGKLVWRIKFCLETGEEGSGQRVKML